MKTKSDYAKDRLNPRWQKKRLEIMKLDDFKCIECESGSKTLNVHHSYYISGRKPWRYPNWSLSTLCEDCHKSRHDFGLQHDDENERENGTFDSFESWERYMSWLTKNSEDREIDDLWWLMADLSIIIKNKGFKTAKEIMADLSRESQK